MASAPIMQLRPYQQQAIADLRQAFRSGVRAPLLVAPTGMGKTVIFSAITQAAAGRGRRVLILVHRRELIRQTGAKLTNAGVTHGIIAAGFEPSDHHVQVASVQTLARRLERQHLQPDLIVIDEAHHAIAAGTWNKVISHWPDSFLLGVTATPVRQDGRGLGAMFTKLVLGPSTADLMAAGYLTPVKIYAPPQVADLTGIRTRAGDYANDQAAAAMTRPTVTGDAISHYQRIAAGQPAIAFCCNVNHATTVCDAFNAAGISAATLLGNTIDRDALVARFTAGELQVLVTVDVVSEGFDCPGAAVAILLRPTQSEGLYLQQVGRVLRPAPGKAAAIILDHVGNVHRHGFPDDVRPWSLDDARQRTGKGGPPAPSVRTCESCFAAFKPAPQCPVCGTPSKLSTRELKQQAGQLEELAREAVARARARDRRQQAKARTLQELIHIGQARGMNNPVAWAKHVHFARSLKHG
jgi:superfamily II DNA or RNA helicase